MAIIECKMCGGDLSFGEGASVAECEYCGSKQTIPNQDNEKKLTLFARADRLRRACEFDKAAGVYESIVADFPEEAEAYWGLVLCRYGIEYVDDPATMKKIPTCHRSSFDSILDDTDFDQACENADAIARRLYRDEAKAIENIRRGILEVSSKEEPYDIFICYKETDENGGRTIDSVIAQDVYDALTEKGYRVFFSRISLEDKLGTEYEPYIFAALNSAKVMLAFGTDFEYFNAVWVKNEWSRFLSLITSGQKKTLVPCYKGIDAYDMPREFAKLQAQDMGKVGAIQDLLRGIDKIMGKGNTMSAGVPSPVAAPQNALTERGMLFLEDEDWAKADEYFERALDQNPHDGQAYLGKVLSMLRIESVAEIDNLVINIQSFKDFSRAIQYATPDKKEMLQKIYDRAHKKWLIKCICYIVKRAAKKKEKEEYLQELEKEKARREAERQRQEEEQTRLRKAEKLQRDNEATRVHILKYFESTDGQFSARELRIALSKHKLEARNIQSNCEVLIQQGKLEQHKDNMRTVYCLVGRANRMAERQAQIEAEARIAQEQQQKREQQIQQLQAEYVRLEQELKLLGVFAFKKKKEIQMRLEEISKQLGR